MSGKSYKLRDEFDREYQSDMPGTLGGHRKGKIFGRLDCPSALSWIARGHYTAQRVFFADREIAVKAGYRPCGHCMKDEYTAWKENPARYAKQVIS